jgi:hypothetical protein
VLTCYIKIRLSTTATATISTTGAAGTTIATIKSCNKKNY